ncbi:Large neutral amino acids transporter small subunit 2 [Paragonimus heterotremus]|uniref:Large neutral amino acids transporter small subunit 2 n=1 Tax=Paragonimus heterotremus TaxID=100268 RepID=A0A8J4WFK5_9TREM|nr:Large neutral amino acids transporter small subunit 2 [Paragonimus heterotremus]
MSIIRVNSNEDLAAKKNSHNDDFEMNKKTGARLEKSIGLLSSITIIVGSVIGSGIFVSPSGILKYTNSFGASIVVWVLCGVFSLLGAYCYAELGSMMPRSGADYSYVLEAFGPFFGFLRLWIEVLVTRPTSAAVIAMVFAQYILQPIFPDCSQPDSALRMLASVCILLVGLINCMSVRWSTRTQDVFTFAKVAALILIIITGFVQIGRGRTETYQDSFEGSNWNPGNLAVAFYTGLFAYSGWNYLNSMIEEMKNARRDLPIAIVISCLLITAVYTIANVAYASVLSVHEILESSAVAVTFAKKVYGPAWFIMPIFVAFSTFGGVNGTIMTTSRIFFVASQENQMPKLLSFLHVDRLTPIPAVIFTVRSLIVVFT